jgi:hypothetical protein
MKISYIVSLLVIALMNAVYQYSIKKDFKPSELDRYIFGISDIVDVLPKGANIEFSAIGVPIDIQTRIRYLLAPRLLSLNNKIRLDTVLTVASLSKSDSLSQALIKNGYTITWQNQDSLLFYIVYTKN